MPKTVTISPAVADVLSRSTVSGPSITLPDGQLDRALYTEVDKVLKALGGKWNRSARAHVFVDGIPPDLGAALAAGSVVDQKKTLEQFYTPVDLALRMVQIAGVTAEDTCLEPSAGNGRLVAQILMIGAEVLAIEFDPRNISSLYHLKGIGGRLYVEQNDFMAVDLRTLGYPAPTVVLMNPPFSRNQDIAHVERAFDMLAPGGRLVAIMSAHWTFANDEHSRRFSAWVGVMGGNCWDNSDMRFDRKGDTLDRACVEKLPAQTFRESGTNVAAVLVTLWKAEA